MVCWFNGVVVIVFLTGLCLVCFYNAGLLVWFSLVVVVLLD